MEMIKETIIQYSMMYYSMYYSVFLPLQIIGLIVAGLAAFVWENLGLEE